MSLSIGIIVMYYSISSAWQHVQFSSVAQSCPTLCDPMNCSAPGLPVHHQLPEFTQTHAHYDVLIKNLPANAGDAREASLILVLGSSTEVGHGNPLQYYCLENSMDRGVRQATVHGVAKSGTWLCAHTQTQHRQIYLLGELNIHHDKGIWILGIIDQSYHECKIQKILFSGLPWWLRWSRICLQCGKPGFDPWVGKIPWRREWQPTPVFLPGESFDRGACGLQSMGHKESDTTEQLTPSLFNVQFKRTQRRKKYMKPVFLLIHEINIFSQWEW